MDNYIYVVENNPFRHFKAFAAKWFFACGFSEFHLQLILDWHQFVYQIQHDKQQNNRQWISATFANPPLQWILLFCIPFTCYLGQDTAGFGFF